jgi:hypothetical protein
MFGSSPGIHPRDALPVETVGKVEILENIEVEEQRESY